MSIVFKTVASLLVCLVVADVIGVVACTLFDVAPLRSNSALLPYAIWLVLGAFCGLSHFAATGAWASPRAEGDWSSRPGAAAIGNRIFWTSLAILILLGILFYLIYWSRGVAGEYYVPDSGTHTVLFFLAVLAGEYVGKEIAVIESGGT